MVWRSRGRILLWLFIVSVALNNPWEIAQAFLYVGMDYSAAMVWHCFVASLGDGLLVLVIYLVGWVRMGQADWFAKPGWRYAAMLPAGFSIAMLVEWVAVHVLGRWAYTEKMPLIPGLDIGVVPVAQMLLLPPLAFHIVSKRIRLV